MTTEEMNRVIAEYLGWKHFDKCKSLTYHEYKGDYESEFEDIWTEGEDLIDGIYSYNEYHDKSIKYHYTLEFDTSWDWLMPVWQKLRGELLTIENLENNKDGYDKWLDKAILFGKSRAYIQSVEKAIAQDTDITTAHRLMVEAIELIKK